MESFHVFTPSFRVSKVLKPIVSLNPSPFGEKPLAPTVTYTGVGRVSIWMPRSSLVVAIPAFEVDFTK